MLIGKLQHKRRKHTIWFLGQNTVLKKAWHKLCDYYSAIWADIFVKLKEYIDIAVLHHILTFQISMYKIGDVANARDTLSSDALTHVTLWNVCEISQNRFGTTQNHITCIIPTLQLDIFTNTWNIAVRSQRDACHAFQTNTMFWPFWSHSYIKQKLSNFTQSLYKHCT